MGSIYLTQCFGEPASEVEEAADGKFGLEATLWCLGVLLHPDQIPAP